MLVLADRWDRGWNACVNGQPAPILCVNHALRGVELPAGRAEIVFRYQPASQAWGLRLGAVAIGLMLISLVWNAKFGPLEGPAILGSAHVRGSLLDRPKCHGMVYRTTAIPLNGHRHIYLAIRPEGARLFSQIALPL